MIPTAENVRTTRGDHEMNIEARLKERANEWETISFHNVHTRKVTWEDCVQISHGFGAICPDCRHAPKCFAKRCRYG
jgi:hypothetical protein